MTKKLFKILPNTSDKIALNYAETNPPYLSLEMISLLNKFNVKHLLLDLPSVDKEQDEGKLAFHHAFWEVPEVNRLDRTITELIYVEDQIKDGLYILELQIAPFENDASPSRPVLYQIEKS